METSSSAKVVTETPLIGWAAGQVAHEVAERDLARAREQLRRRSAVEAPAPEGVGWWSWSLPAAVAGLAGLLAPVLAGGMERWWVGACCGLVAALVAVLCECWARQLALRVPVRDVEAPVADLLPVGTAFLIGFGLAAGGAMAAGARLIATCAAASTCGGLMGVAVAITTAGWRRVEEARRQHAESVAQAAAGEERVRSAEVAAERARVIVERVKVAGLHPAAQLMTIPYRGPAAEPPATVGLPALPSASL